MSPQLQAPGGQERGERLSLIEWMRAYGIPRVGLGCWRLCAPGRPVWAKAVDTIRQAYEAGVRLFDTADSYGVDEREHGYGEGLVREALAGSDAVVVTKGGFARPGGVWEGRATPMWVTRAIELSAERLGVSRLDCYLLHGVDPRVDLVESARPILEARAAGRIRWAGLSNVSVAQAARVMAIAPIDVVQNRLSVTVRPGGTEDMLRFCETNRIAFMAHTPLGPVLADGERYRVQECGPVRRIAEARGVSTAVVAIAWLLALSPQLIAIPGARRPESIRDSLSAADLSLGADEIAEISAAEYLDPASVRARA
jgi:aryl-alcohol dehydrogenase-like predicted oxidoreductase